MAPREKISSKFITLLVPFICAVFLLAGGVIAFIEYRMLSAELMAKGDRLVTLSSILLDAPIWNVDRNQIQQIQNAMSQDKDVAWIDITISSVPLFAHDFHKNGMNTKGLLPFKSNIYHGNDPNTRLANVTIYLTRAPMMQQIEFTILLLFTTMITLLATVILLNHFIQRRVISRPLETLLAGINANAGGKDFQPVVIASRDELGFLGESFNAMMRSLKENAVHLENMVVERGRLLDELRILNEDLEHRVALRTEELSSANTKLSAAMKELWGEMELAKKIQTLLLPEKPVILGYDIAASMLPADEVGGDYYDIIAVGGYTWIVIGDVSGHGVPAGLVMMMVQTAIYTVLLGNPDTPPSDLLTTINRSIYGNIQRMNEQKHMTIMVMACGVEGHFTFSGLHEDILLWRAKTEKVEHIRTNGMWLGLEPNISGMLSEDVMQMEIGDCMVLITDGIIEARRNGQFFGDERLTAVVESFGRMAAAKVHAEVWRALEDFQKTDDSTLMVVKRER